jgi:small subunit ribosomal protein S6
MPVELYETLFLLDSNKLSADPDSVKGHLHASIEKHGGRVEVERPWDDRKLAYPIKKHMTIHVDPKWSEAVMDVARNDHATAFALRGMQEETAPTDVNPSLSENLPEGEAVAAATGGRRPRREAVAEKPE